MSKYTTEVRFICESKSGFTEDEIKSKTVDEIISNSRAKIFNFNYPIYDVQHKPELETKILKHYYTREISAETYGLWQLWLNDKMNLIMPKYNKLYSAEHEILNKELKNIDVTSNGSREDDFTRTDNLHEARDFTRTDNLHEEFDSTRTDNLTHTNSHNDLNTRKFSDTPQGSITFAEANEEYYWLTDYTEQNNTGGATDTDTGTQRTAGINNNTGTQRNAGGIDNTGTQRNAGTSLNDVTETGYRGAKVYAELLEAYSQKVVNIDMMIVNELKDLFFKLW